MLRVMVAGARWARRSWAAFACLTALVAGASVVGAQGPAGEVPPPPPPLPAPTPESAPPPASPPGGASTCVPTCRDGYTCVEGKCVEACNPPCAAGTHCTGAGECLPDAPPPPPTYATAPVYPQAPLEPPIDLPDPGAERHDGFMLRLAIGFGGGVASAKAGGTDAEYSGAGASFSIDLGGAPSENLVIHARIADFVIVDPSVSIDGVDLGSSDVSLGAFLFGPALTYYIMPANLYFTGAVGLSYLSVDSGTDSASSDVGLGLNLDFGKEWWASDNWGLGVAGRFWFTTLTDESSSFGVSEDWTYLAFAILFSATYQ